MRSKRRNRTSTDRQQRRELERIKLKLKAYLSAFYSIVYFEEEHLDWNLLTEMEYKRLRGKWKAYCKTKGYSDEISAAFQLDCMLLKTDLILQVKYQAEGEGEQLMKYLRKGMTPLELADYAKKNLNLKPIVI